MKVIRLFASGVSKERLEPHVKHIGLSGVFVEDPNKADVIVTNSFKRADRLPEATNRRTIVVLLNLETELRPFANFDKYVVCESNSLARAIEHVVRVAG